MSGRSRNLIVALALLLAARLVGCAASPSPYDDAEQQAQDLATNLSTFETDPHQASSFTDGVPALFTDGLPALFTTQGLGVQDLSTPIYSGPYPAAASPPPAGTPLKALPETLTSSDGTVETRTWYKDGTYQLSIQAPDGATVESEIAAPPATSALPAAFATLLSPLPASMSVNQVALTFPVYERTGSGVGYRWNVYDTTGSKPQLLAWIRGIQLERFGNQLDETQLAADYQTTSAGTFATRQVTDSLSIAQGLRYYMDSRYDASTDTWAGNGYFANLKTGVTANISQTWNRTTYEKLKTVTMTTLQGAQLRLYQHFLGDRSGTGAGYDDGVQILALRWDTSGKGTLTLTRRGKSVPYRAF